MPRGIPMKQVEQEIAELFCKLPLFLTSFVKEFEPFVPVKLNATEERTLMNVYMEPDEPMVVYSKHAGLSQGAFTSVADSLERKGLVQRIPMKRDRRVYSLKLTESGYAVTNALKTQFKDFIAKKVSNMNPDSINSLRDAMRVLIDSVKMLG
jgi:DNA-binding MarR family transcriptional regulator